MTENVVSEIVEQPPQEHEGKKQVEKREVLELKSGLVSPNSVEQQFRLANMYLKSKMLPSRFTTAEQIVAALHFVGEHFPSSPLTALRNTALINGTPQFFGELPLAIALKSGLIASIEEYILDEDFNQISWKNKNLKSKAFAAVCIIKRKGQRQAKESFFTLDDAKLAGLYPCSNPDKPWAKYTKIMLKFRARSQALKDIVPDSLNGLGIVEYEVNGMAEPDGHVDPKLLETNAAQELHEALMEDDHTITPV